jgi:hypothetical protein
MESGRTILRASKHCSTPGGEASTLAASSKGAYASAEYAFDALLHDSVIEVFNETLGNIAGEALLEAVRNRTSSKTEDPLEKPDLLHQLLIGHLGAAAHVLERRIVKTLASKTVAAIALRETDRADFVSEVGEIRKRFLKRKQSCNRPQTIE